MDPNPFRIIVVGGGIAGLAAAIALRGPGREIVVLEKSRMLREVGALISLQPNASKIISSWNIDEFIRSSEPVIDEKIRVMDTDGLVVNEVPIDSHTFGADRVVYHRQDLHSSLRAAATSKSLAGRPAQIRTSCHVLRVDTAAGTVELDGGEVLEGDLIVGADGIRSAVRESVLQSKVEANPTGLSAYRLLIPVEKLKNISVAKEIFDPERKVTTVIVGHDKRIVMGPGRGCKLFGMVALVPDEKLSEISHSDSWTADGSVERLQDCFASFPSWLHEIFKAAPEVALWQLRDIPPLGSWTAGRAILIGDAAHAMLPLQGQGASQSIEDAEALQAFFSDITSRPPPEVLQDRLKNIFDARYERASLIQSYSRQQSQVGTAVGSKKVTLRPEEFMEFNCNYAGAKDWASRNLATRQAPTILAT